MNKKGLSERDLCTKFITPALTGSPAHRRQTATTHFLDTTLHQVLNPAA